MEKRKAMIFAGVAALVLGSNLALAQPDEERVVPIDEMFSLADQNSMALRASATGIGEAQEAVRVAKNARLPEVEASLAFSYLGDGYLIDRDFSGGMRTPMPHFGNSFALEASQIIYAGGAISGSIAIAQLQEASARLQQDGARNQLRFLLVGYYLDLFKQRNLLRVYGVNIEQTKQVLKDLRAKGEEGIMLRNDITRYELLLVNFELAQTQIQNTIAILNRNLTTSLGLPSNTSIAPDTSILSKILPSPAADDEYWTRAAAEHSPALQQLSLGVQISEHHEKIVKAERLPQVALVAGNHLDGPITIEVPPINSNFSYWYVGVGLKYKLSSLYNTGASVSKSKLATQRSRDLLDDATEQTELAVRADFIRYREAYDQLRTQQKSVELAQQNYSVVSNRYRNDMALITDMLDASNAKLAAEVQLANAQISIVFGHFKLLYISGTLISYQQK